MQGKIIAGLVCGGLAVLAFGTTAQAKPPAPPAPYQLGHEIVTNPDVYLPPRGNTELIDAAAECPSGKVAVGGGYGLRTRLDGEPLVARSLASPVQSKPGSTSWSFSWTGDVDASQVTVYVVCVNS